MFIFSSLLSNTLSDTWMYFMEKTIQINFTIFYLSKYLLKVCAKYRLILSKKSLYLLWRFLF